LALARDSTLLVNNGKHPRVSFIGLLYILYSRPSWIRRIHRYILLTPDGLFRLSNLLTSTSWSSSNLFPCE
jgi:hypothetical protein